MSDWLMKEKNAITLSFRAPPTLIAKADAICKLLKISRTQLLLRGLHLALKAPEVRAVLLKKRNALAQLMSDLDESDEALEKLI